MGAETPTSNQPRLEEMERNMDASLEAIYGDFHSSLRSFTLRRVSDLDTAEDILQDVYLKIHLHISDLQKGESLESWIYRITRNVIIDYYRRVRPQDDLPESLASPIDEEPDAVSELALSVRGMLHCIPPKYRQALELTELQGYSQVELAKKLNISVSGAKSRVQRARQKLKEAFMDCCHFEFDRLGRVVDYHPKCEQCTVKACDENCDGDSS